MYQVKNLFAEVFPFNWDNIVCLISIWQLMILLFLRHALEVTDPDGDDYLSAFFSVSLEFITLISSSFPFSQISDIAHLLHIVFNRTVQIFLLRVAGFLLPCYIMACAVNILQRRQRRQVDITSQRYC